jgi:Putative prokaryotic signal transducing protein
MPATDSASNVTAPTQFVEVDGQRYAYRRFGAGSAPTYATTVDANIAKIALDAAGVPSLIVGVGAAMEGGAEGVRLLVPEERVASALRVLEDLGRTKSGAPP